MFLRTKKSCNASGSGASPSSPLLSHKIHGILLAQNHPHNGSFEIQNSHPILSTCCNTFNSSHQRNKCSSKCSGDPKPSSSGCLDRSITISWCYTVTAFQTGFWPIMPFRWLCLQTLVGGVEKCHSKRQIFVEEISAGSVSILNEA